MNICFKKLEILQTRQDLVIKWIQYNVQLKYDRILKISKMFELIINLRNNYYDVTSTLL